VSRTAKRAARRGTHPPDLGDQGPADHPAVR
jgi:hypothetical protein